MDNILNKFNDQITENKILQDGLKERLKTYSKYNVGHHPGNKQFLRKAKNYKERLFFEENVPEGIRKTNLLLEADEWLLKRFDNVAKLARELTLLRDSDNFLIMSTNDKDIKFNNLEKALKKYSEQKAKIPSINGKKKIDGDYILAGLELINSDRILWEKGVLAKFNEEVTTNSISKQILNSNEIDILENESNISAENYKSAKEILAKFFSLEGKILETTEYSREEILEQLNIANNNITAFNSDVQSFISNLIDSLKNKNQSLKILEKSNLLNLSDRNTKYQDLYKLNNDYQNLSQNTSTSSLERVTTLISKSIEIIKSEKSLTSELQSFIDNELKTKVKNVGSDFSNLLGEFELKNTWDNIIKYVNANNVDFANLNGQDYLTKRNSFMDQFASIKTNIIEFANKLKNNVSSFVVKSIESLKTKADEKNLLIGSKMFNLNSRTERYNELYNKGSEFKSYSTSLQYKNIDSLLELVTKVNNLNNDEKSLNDDFASFVESELKTKVNEFKGNLSEYIKFLKLNSDWKEIKDFSNTSNVDFSQYKKEEYLVQRNELIDKFVNVKNKILQLKDKSLLYYEYAKSRISAFKEAYNQRKQKLEDFNLFNFSYSEISAQEERANKALSTNFNNFINSENKDLSEFLNDLLNMNKFGLVDTDNFNSVKNTILSNINDVDKLPTAYEFTYSKINGYKSFKELSDIKEAKLWFDSKIETVEAIMPTEWVDSNIDTVKESMNFLFNAIDEIQEKATKINEIKTNYTSFLDTVVNEISKIENTLDKNHNKHQRNIDAAKKIVSGVTNDYLNVSSQDEFQTKIQPSSIKVSEDFANAWLEIFKKYDKHVEYNNSIKNEFEKYSHLDIAYIKDDAVNFATKQQELIENSVDEFYKQLEANIININKNPLINDDNDFADQTKTLLVSFVKNFYNVLVNKFGYNTVYNFEAPKYYWDNSADKFTYKTMNILFNGNSKYANKTEAMNDASKYKTNVGLKSSSYRNLYERYGFNNIIYGLESNGKNFNELLVDGGWSKINYEVWYYDTIFGIEVSKKSRDDEISSPNWIYAKWNNSISDSEIGSNVSSAISKIKSNSAPYVLDSFFALLNYENRLVNNFINQLKSKINILTRNDYEKNFTKLVKSFAKLTYASILITLGSFQSNSNKAIEIPFGYSHKDDEHYSSRFYDAGMSKILPVKVSSKMHSAFNWNWVPSKQAFSKGWITHNEGLSSQVSEDNWTNYDRLHSDIKAEFEKNNVNISYNSTHVISTSGPFQFKLKQSDYFNFEWKNQHIFAAFYNKIGFDDEFGNKFNAKHFDWWRFKTLTEYKRAHGNDRENFDYLRAGIKSHSFTDFFTNSKIKQLVTYTPVTE
ncbi:hypothetical protein [Mycoplasmopsis caviae]|uniref:Uncharacterized protein n=1 Tax=Mycoplasmopsis caviae TaxID=55603 RepID=A0A3P8MD92_9BACT|nr:hypothetical protein [Mycoplasmopsis caviae]VDR41540.1 Uncharacterised protein [Mycoplasmopsis caviae]